MACTINHDQSIREINHRKFQMSQDSHRTASTKNKHVYRSTESHYRMPKHQKTYFSRNLVSGRDKIISFASSNSKTQRM